jgi:hypothetical protein
MNRREFISMAMIAPTIPSAVAGCGTAEAKQLGTNRNPNQTVFRFIGNDITFITPDREIVVAACCCTRTFLDLIYSFNATCESRLITTTDEVMQFLEENPVPCKHCRVTGVFRETIPEP